MIPDINWGILHSAELYYLSKGFEKRNTPWVVDDNIARKTFDGEGITCSLGTLVGSAEQGFLSMFKELEEGIQYYSITPCFRNEPIINETHYSYFIKLELFQIINKYECYDMMDMIGPAKDFHEQYCKTEMVRTNDGYDLEINGIEVGSYGIRKYDEEFNWAYGTGVALPRFDYAFHHRS